MLCQNLSKYKKTTLGMIIRNSNVNSSLGNLHGTSHQNGGVVKAAANTDVESIKDSPL